MKNNLLSALVPELLIFILKNQEVLLNDRLIKLSKGSFFKHKKFD
jgi:hypothetical protein